MNLTYNLSSLDNDWRRERKEIDEVKGETEKWTERKQKQGSDFLIEF